MASDTFIFCDISTQKKTEMYIVNAHTSLEYLFFALAILTIVYNIVKANRKCVSTLSLHIFYFSC